MYIKYHCGNLYNCAEIVDVQIRMYVITVVIL